MIWTRDTMWDKLTLTFINILLILIILWSISDFLNNATKHLNMCFLNNIIWYYFWICKLFIKFIFYPQKFRSLLEIKSWNKILSNNNMYTSSRYFYWASYKAEWILGSWIDNVTMHWLEFVTNETNINNIPSIFFIKTFCGAGRDEIFCLHYYYLDTIYLFIYEIVKGRQEMSLRW